jgi:hypothetical protein
MHVLLVYSYDISSCSERNSFANILGNYEMIVHSSSGFVFLQSKRSVFMFLKQKYQVVDKL